MKKKTCGGSGVAVDVAKERLGRGEGEEREHPRELGEKAMQKRGRGEFGVIVGPMARKIIKY